MPRPPSYRPYAVSLALAGLLLAGCSSTGAPDDPPPAESDAAEGFTAPELDGTDGAETGGGAPRFSGRRALTIADARREVVDEPCTANVIERLCGSSARFVLRPEGPRRPLTLTSASTRTEAGGLTWRVRLGFAPGAGLRGPRPDRVQVLEGPDDLQVEVGDGARVAGRTIVLTGLVKANAWRLVDRVARP